jgi:putative spermidine/putrescine transport system ATP-binding protein
MSGERLMALAATSVTMGDRTTVSVRPEKVRVQAAPSEAANRFAAKVMEVIYLGDHRRVRVAVCGSSDFLLKLDDAAPCDVGDILPICWDADDGRALDAVGN